MEKKTEVQDAEKGGVYYPGLGNAPASVYEGNGGTDRGQIGLLQLSVVRESEATLRDEDGSGKEGR